MLSVIENAADALASGEFLAADLYRELDTLKVLLNNALELLPQGPHGHPNNIWRKTCLRWLGRQDEYKATRPGD